MEIQINDDWRLVSDSNCVILQKRSKGGKTIAKGKYKGQITQDSWSSTYHPTIKRALAFLVERHVQGLQSVTEVAASIEKLQADIEAMEFPHRVGG